MVHDAVLGCAHVCLIRKGSSPPGGRGGRIGALSRPRHGRCVSSWITAALMFLRPGFGGTFIWEPCSCTAEGGRCRRDGMSKQPCASSWHIFDTTHSVTASWTVLEPGRFGQQIARRLASASSWRAHPRAPMAVLGPGMGSSLREEAIRGMASSGGGTAGITPRRDRSGFDAAGAFTSLAIMPSCLKSGRSRRSMGGCSLVRTPDVDNERACLACFLRQRCCPETSSILSFPHLELDVSMIVRI